MVRLLWWTETFKKTVAKSSSSSSPPPPLAVSPSRPANRPRLSSRDAAGRRTRSRTLSGELSLISTSNSGSHSTITTTTTTTITTTTPLMSPPRRRMNSRDIPRSYSGLYGFAGDLLPFEMNRQRTSFFPWTASTTSLLWLVLSYATLLAVLQMTSLLVLAPATSWTATNAMHLAVTLIYIHWLKGSLYDEQGEMNALTIWEQLEATVDTKSVRRLLLAVPTLLTYAACHFAAYDPLLCLFNVTLWIIAILAKLPMMNGVRIFGINRTVGIDDEEEEEEKENDAATTTTTTTTTSSTTANKGWAGWDDSQLLSGKSGCSSSSSSSSPTRLAPSTVPPSPVAKDKAE